MELVVKVEIFARSDVCRVFVWRTRPMDLVPDILTTLLIALDGSACQAPEIVSR
jgi:hypothetical protein